MFQIASNKWLILLSAVFLYVLTIVSFVKWVTYRDDIREWRPAVVKHIVPVDSEFEELWELTAYIHGKGGLASTGSNVYISGSFENNSPEFLVSLDLLTGQIEWQQRLHRNQSLDRVDSHYIYIHQSATQKIANLTQMWGTAEIIAYDIESHDEVWNQKFAGSGGAHIENIVEDIIIVKANSGLYQVDSHTGEQISGPQRQVLLATRDGIQYQRSYDEGLQGIDIEAKEVVWTYKASVFAQLVFEDDIILIGNGVSAERGGATALNGNTGEILWKQRDVISNIATSNGIAYLIQLASGEWYQDVTLDAQLLAVDIRTGEVLSTLRFEPSEIRSGHGHYEYLVAASDDIVLVYLGDGRQLIALRFSPDK